ncbi:hypothetical protein HYC85_012577 [Camellia sinensis]|uniref:EF-hand domain-containing protein n=1 Tax=Camellia sinensis TaxID=4442 RepID=A0A7J7HF73_CAMSI|nr:hypothetical protein HYC85_012577 [Camellia sinensis]
MDGSISSTSSHSSMSGYLGFYAFMLLTCVMRLTVLDLTLPMQLEYLADEDSNGTIDLEELKKCLQKLQLHLTKKEIDDLFHSCDVDGSEGIQFKEFIVLLCLIYLLMDHSNSPHTTSKMGSPQIEATFDTIIEAFLFLDKNGDGKLNKKDMVKALNGDSPLEISPAHVTRTRFEEMDWERKGKVGIDADDEILVAEISEFKKIKKYYIS